MIFDETYYHTEIRGEVDHPHFQQRAEWIKEFIKQINPTAPVYILGCAFGYLVKHLRELGVVAYGVESSEYAVSQRVSEFVVCAKAETFPFPSYNPYYTFSWNMLDCLTEDVVSILSQNLKNSIQIHVVCCSGDYPRYLIKPMEYWRKYFPAIVDHTSKTSDPEGLGLPLSWGLVSD